MELLYQCIHEIPELQFVIQSPVIKVSEKIRLFEESFRTSFSPLTFSFINLVLERRREEYLAGISRYFLGLLKAEQGIQSAELVTATPWMKPCGNRFYSLSPKNSIPRLNCMKRWMIS